MRLADIERMALSIIEDGQVECDYVEYKRSATFKDKILKTVCAYANNFMNREIGLLYIGVEEVNDEESGRKAYPKRPIAGIDKGSIETVENSLKSLIAEVKPKPVYHLLNIELDGKICIVIAVEPGSEGPYETSERAERDKKIGLKAGRYIRVKRDSRMPNKREEFELLKKFADYHFSSELNETATLDDLNYEYMREYLVRTHAREDVKSLSKLDLALSMGLVSGSEFGGYRAKNFAVLMFANRPEEFIPGAHVEIIREVRGTDRMVATKFDGPIWIQVERAIDFFREVVMEEYTVREEGVTGHRIVRNWPEAMFAELATNCVLHKEYGQKQYIGIYVYRNQISFVNHNRPLPPVTIDDLRTKEQFNDRNYLNDEIKEMFFALDLIESYGSGIRRAKRAMKENGNPELIFRPENDIDDYLEVIAPVNPEFARMRDEEEAREKDTTQEIAQESELTTQKTTQKTTQRQRGTAERIARYLKENPKASATDISNDLDIGYENVRYHLRAMRANGRLVHEGPDRGGMWIVNE